MGITRSEGFLANLGKINVFILTRVNPTIMNATEQTLIDEQTLSRCGLAPIFAEIMSRGQITLSDWQQLMTAPLDNSFTSNDEAILIRLIYGVHRGLVKIVD